MKNFFSIAMALQLITMTLYWLGIFAGIDFLFSPDLGHEDVILKLIGVKSIAIVVAEHPYF